MIRNEKYVDIRVVKHDGTCDHFYQYPFEHMVILGADNKVCVSSGDRKEIINLNDVAYVKIKQITYSVERKQVQ